jgi:hypothetical protein
MRNSKKTRALWFLVSCMAWAATSWTEPDWSGSVGVAREADPGSSVIIASPDGNLPVVFGLYETTGRTAVPCYDVLWRGRLHEYSTARLASTSRLLGEGARSGTWGAWLTPVRAS